MYFIDNILVREREREREKNREKERERDKELLEIIDTGIVDIKKKGRKKIDHLYRVALPINLFSNICKFIVFKFLVL